MNTPTPTPRTDAAWAKTFEDDDDQCRAGNAATDMRDASATLERELAALTAEVKRLNRAYEYDHKCLYEVRGRCELWKQRALKAEADLAAERARLDYLLKWEVTFHSREDIDRDMKEGAK
jgi:hypothetical protein